jgi:transcriptional regulator with XRE-family HTH domain
MRLSAHFGARLAAIRLDRGLTLAELAALIGRTKTTIGRWEHSGPAEIHRSDVAKCAHVLRCSRKVLLAPLDETIPPAPSSWPRTRRRIKQHVAAVTGSKRSSVRRSPVPDSWANFPASLRGSEGRWTAIGPRRADPSQPYVTPAFEQALELLPKLLPAELELLLELKTQGRSLSQQWIKNAGPDASNLKDEKRATVG